MAAGDAEPDALRGRRAPRRPHADADRGAARRGVRATQLGSRPQRGARTRSTSSLLEFPGGRLGQITIDRLCKAGTRYVELRADCEHASLRASYGGRALLQAGLKRAERPAIRLVYGLGGVAWIERGTSRKTIGRNPRHPEIVATRALFGKILEAFAEGREPPSSAREARTVLEVIAAAYRSAETGERVALSGAETGSASATSV